MKKILSISLVFLLIAVLFIPVFAVDNPYVVDNASLLSAEEQAELNEKLAEISARQKFDVVVVTVNSTEGKTPEAYADDYFDYNGYGYGVNHDGCLLLISMEYRDWHISTTGYGITALTDYGISYIGDKVVSYMSDGEWAEAFNKYADLCDEFVTQAREGEPFDVNNVPEEKNTVLGVLVSIGGALIIALIVIVAVKSKYKPVRFQRNAGQYLVDGSMNLTGAYDNFRTTAITKRQIQTSSSGGSSTHTGSSGTSHGGGGGKF